MKHSHIIFIFILVIFISSSILLSQQTEQTEENTKTNTLAEPIAPAATTTPIEGFDGIILGSNMETTIDLLMQNPLINLPRKYQHMDIAEETSENFITIGESKFFRSGYFLFQNNSLYAITIRYQQTQVDFLDLLNALNDKYGRGNFLDANTVAWEYGDRQMILERPSTVKYILTNVANDVRVNYTNNIVTNSINILKGL